jgi:hypothetical protein
MHVPVRNDRNALPPLQKLHHFLSLSSHFCPARFRLAVLFESSQVSTIELEIDLFEFPLCSQTNREVLVF